MTEAAPQAKIDCQVDTARTRVTRYRLAPGATTGAHRHEHDYVIVPVTSGRLRVVANGQEIFADLASGVSYARPAGVQHEVFNAGSGEMVFVEVELKP
ncbi:MAG TPA: cupin domain-containing protein [Stellaceae bacterium]|nr:cupin domain-containing protein [Stellaceae bacterium]